MLRLLKIVLKLAPLTVGLAFILNQIEAKRNRFFSWKRVLILFLTLSSAIFLSAMIYVRVHYNDTFMGKIQGCAVVFGAAVWKDDQPSNALNDRTQAAITLYKNQQVSCLVFSGGASKYGAHEVTVMGKLAQKALVPEAVITYDFVGNNTLATLFNLPKNKPYVLVSNDFHLARIGLMARKIGLEEYYLHAAPYEYGRYNKTFNYYWREVATTLLVWFGL